MEWLLSARQPSMSACRSLRGRFDNQFVQRFGLEDGRSYLRFCYSIEGDLTLVVDEPSARDGWIDDQTVVGRECLLAGAAIERSVQWFDVRQVAFCEKGRP